MGSSLSRQSVQLSAAAIASTAADAAVDSPTPHRIGAAVEGAGAVHTGQTAGIALIQMLWHLGLQAVASAGFAALRHDNSTVPITTTKLNAARAYLLDAVSTTARPAYQQL